MRKRVSSQHPALAGIHRPRSTRPESHQRHPWEWTTLPEIRCTRTGQRPANLRGFPTLMPLLLLWYNVGAHCGRGLRQVRTAGRPVYRGEWSQPMQIDDFIWLPDMIEKLAAKHGVEQDEVEDVFFKPATIQICRIGTSSR